MRQTSHLHGSALFKIPLNFEVYCSDFFIHFSILNLKTFFLQVEVVMKFDVLHNESNTKCYTLKIHEIHDYMKTDYFTFLLTGHPSTTLIVA